MHSTSSSIQVSVRMLPMTEYTVFAPPEDLCVTLNWIEKVSVCVGAQILSCRAQIMCGNEAIQATLGLRDKLVFHF